MYATFQKYGGNMHLMTASSYIPFLCKGVNTFEEMQRIQDDKSHPLNATIKDLRFKAKAINFLCEFGGSASVLAEHDARLPWISLHGLSVGLKAEGAHVRGIVAKAPPVALEDNGVARKDQFLRRSGTVGPEGLQYLDGERLYSEPIANRRRRIDAEAAVYG